MKYIPYIGLFLFITLVSCNKNEKKKITPDLENCCFKTKTYWVYIDSVSNVIDSVYVVDRDRYFTEAYITDYTSYDIERYTFTTENSTTLESQTFEVCQSYLYEVNAHDVVIYFDYDDLDLDGPICNTYERLDSAFIYDRYYYRIIKVEIPEDCYEDQNKDIYYTNSEYGILRHDTYSDSVLLSSKILMRKKIKR